MVIKAAGPAAIVAFLLTGLLVLLIMRMLGVVSLIVLMMAFGLRYAYRRSPTLETTISTTRGALGKTLSMRVCPSLWFQRLPGSGPIEGRAGALP